MTSYVWNHVQLSFDNIPSSTIRASAWSFRTVDSLDVLLTLLSRMLSCSAYKTISFSNVTRRHTAKP